MNRSMLTLLLLGVASPCLAQEPAVHLPTPEYHRLASDPDWLVHVVQFHGHLGPAVVAGARAQYKGTGRINGAGAYGFLLTCIDGALPGGGGTDKFRIKIWDKGTGVVVYDNQIGTSDDAAPTTVLGGGSIVIHTK